MISDVSVVVISMSVILLCWAVVRLNQKLEDSSHSRKQPNDIGPESGCSRPAGESTEQQPASETKATA
jgi:hypothetical protein